MKIIGSHMLIDMEDVAINKLIDVKFIENVLLTACEKAGATILNHYFHKFGGEGGVTGIVALAESHMSIHTWPEYGFASIDIFMCGESIPDKALQYIEESFSPGSMDVKNIGRGLSISLIKN